MLTTARTLFVGDAAAATDAMTGEGIGQALLTGVLAAEAIAAGGLDAAQVTATYERSVRDALVADHRMSLLLIRALKHRKGARVAVRIAGATAGRAATSPGGCSRTTRGPSWPRPAGGTAACSPAPAPTARTDSYRSSIQPLTCSMSLTGSGPTGVMLRTVTPASL